MRKCDFLIVLIVEGAAEDAIITALMEDGLTFFNASDLIDNKMHRRTNQKNFENRFLKRDYGGEKLVVIRVIDSRSEKFKVSKGFIHTISGLYTTLTRPEIEALVVISEGRWFNYQKRKSKIKPSEFCKSILKMTDIKEYEFVSSYFRDTNKLVKAITEHFRIIQINKDEHTLMFTLEMQHREFVNLP